MTAQRLRRAVLVSTGWGLIGVGVALLFLPGPGLLTILAGLALLATQFAWAQEWVKRAREAAAAIAGGVFKAFSTASREMKKNGLRDFRGGIALPLSPPTPNAQFPPGSRLA